MFEMLMDDAMATASPVTTSATFANKSLFPVSADEVAVVSWLEVWSDETIVWFSCFGFSPFSLTRAGSEEGEGAVKSKETSADSSTGISDDASDMGVADGELLGTGLFERPTADSASCEAVGLGFSVGVGDKVATGVSVGEGNSDGTSEDNGLSVGTAEGS